MDHNRTPEKALEEIVYLPDAKILRVASLGFTNLLADLFWIRSVLYFGKHTIDEDNPFYHVLKKRKASSKEATQLNRHDQHITDTHPYQVSSDSNQINLSQLPILRSVFFNFESQDMAPYIYPLLRRVVELDPHFFPPYEFGGFVVMMDSGEI